MTAKRKRLDALEVQARQREGGTVRADLAGLTDAELDAVHVDVLRRDGHTDLDGEAVRSRAEIEAMSEEDLRAYLARFGP